MRLWISQLIDKICRSKKLPFLTLDQKPIIELQNANTKQNIKNNNKIFNKK